MGVQATDHQADKGTDKASAQAHDQKVEVPDNLAKFVHKKHRAQKHAHASMSDQKKTRTGYCACELCRHCGQRCSCYF